MKHKRLVSMLLALVLVFSLLPVIPAFAASYDLRVNNIQVTDSNKNNILGDANNTVSYNSSTKMLTIKGNFEASSTWAIYSAIPNLTIYTAEDSLITAASGGIRCKNGVTFGGPGQLTINAQTDAGIAVDAPDSGESSDILLFNTQLGILATKKGIAFSDDSMLRTLSSTLSIISAHASIECDNAELLTSTVSVYSTQDRGFRGGSHSTSPALTIYSSAVSAAGYSTSVGDYKTISLIGDSYLYSGAYNETAVVIKRDDTTKYDLHVGGRQVSDRNKDDILGDGAFAFDSSSKTLSIKKNYTYTPVSISDTVLPAVLSNISLNVAVGSDVTLNAGNADAFTMTGSSYTTMTFKGAGKLSVKTKGIAFNLVGDDSNAHDLVFDGAKIDVTDTSCKNGIVGSVTNGSTVQLKNNANVKLYVGGTAIDNCGDVYLNDSYLYAEAYNGGCYGLYGPYGTGTSSYVKINNSGLYAHGAKGAIVNFGKIQTANSELTTPAGGTYDTGTVYSASSTVAATAEFSAATMYNLWVGGKQASSLNKDDILGDGAAAYDPSSKTLTLKGNISAVDQPAIRSQIDGLIIKPTKNLSITANGSNAMYLEKTANIYGGGRITMTATNNHGVSIKDGTLALKDADVKITCTGTTKDGLYGNGAAQLVLNNSRLEINSDRYAVSNFAGGIAMTNEVIESPAGAAVSGGFIKLGGLPVEDLVIVPGTPSTTTYTVTFNANGHGTAPAAQTVEEGQTATKPTDPTAAGWIFGGWFKEAACTTAYNFSTPVTANITLYAKWTENTTPGPGTTTYTVTFNANGHGSAPAPQSVEEGKTASKPADPTASGWKFGGWYTEAACANAYNFSTPVTADITLYAKWTADGSAPTNPFTDVSESDWFYDAVIWATTQTPPITSGTTPTTFAPNKNCSRAEVVQFLWNAAGQPVETGVENPFTDVKDTDWFYNAVMWAVKNNITKGTTPTTFAPSKTCTRCEVVQFVWNTKGQPAGSGDISKFTDVPADSWYAAALSWAIEKGVTSGTTPTTFAPDKKCSRAEIVVFLYNARTA